jgi:hypothetical protein
VRETLKECKQKRYASAVRFQLIVDAAYFDKHEPTIFIEVRAREITGTTDLVYVYPNGSVACTNPYHANHGMPCEQIFAAYLNGHLRLNVVIHYHPEYLQPFAKQLSDEQKLSVSTTPELYNNKDSLIKVIEGATYNYATTTTESEWVKVGHGGVEYAHILHPTLHSIRSSKDSVAEMIKKEWHFVQPILLRNEDMRIRYFQLINSFKAELAFTARETAAARGVGV